MNALPRSLVLLGALGLSQCQRAPEPERAPPAATVPSASAQPEPKPVANFEPVPPAAPVTSANASEWIEASLYKFRVSTIRRCSASAPTTKASVAAGTSTGARIGITVQVTAKVDSLLASLRDITLEHNGVIVQAELKPEPACGTPLSTKQLRSGETALGVVVFSLPDATFQKGLTLHFKPTRWGGAPDVTVRIPECLADCDSSTPKQVSQLR